MGDIFDAIAEDYGCGGCGEIISPLIWKKCKLIEGKRFHPGCEPKAQKKVRVRNISERIRIASPKEK